MYSISKKFSFEYAHRLINLGYSSKCKNIHGHSGQLIVEVSSKLIQNNGLLLDLIDFNDIKDFIDEYDHCLLIAKNDKNLLDIAEQLNTKYKKIECGENTSMECILKNIESDIKNIIYKKIKNVDLNINNEIYLKLTLKETNNNSATLTTNLI